jgi:hypothetical protein
MTVPIEIRRRTPPDDRPQGGVVTNQPQHVIAVVCRNYTQFRNWCYDNHRNPRDPSLRLVTEEHHVRGCWFDDVILVDGRQALMAVAQTRLRRG